MSAWVYVARRELQGRRGLWVAAFVLGLLALGAPFVFASDARPATAAVVALLFTAFLAFAVCGSMIGGELAERRLSFYFTRPLSAGAIFVGKLAAATALAFGAQILIWVPTMIVDKQFNDATLPFATMLAALTPLLLALGFVSGIVARCRTRWLLVSAGVAVLMVVLVVFLAVEGALGWELGWLSRARALVLFGGGVGGIALALLAGVAAAVAYGRTDPIRAHRAVTVVAALVLVPVGSAALAMSHRALRPRLEDVVSVDVAKASPRGDWLYVSGDVAADRGGWKPDFLLHTPTGRSERMGWLVSDVEPAFSADGARVAWVELESIYDVVGRKDPSLPEVTLVVRELGARTEVRTEVAVEDVQGVGWSPDGRLISIVGENEAQLRHADTLHLVAQAKARKGATWMRAAFVSTTVLRLFANDGGGTDVVDLRAETRSSATIGHLDINRVFNSGFDVSPDGTHVLAQDPDGAVRLWPVDGGPATTLETLRDGGFCGGYLSDGRIAIGHGSIQGRGAARVHIYSGEGALLRAVDLGFGLVACVVDGHRLLAAVNPRPNPTWDQQRLSLVDADRGTAQALDPRLRILSTWRGIVEPPSVERLLVGDVDGSLLDVDPSTGKTKVLLRGHVP